MQQKKSPWLTLLLLVIAIVGSSLCFMQFKDYRYEKETLTQEKQLLTVTQNRLTAAQALKRQQGQLEADQKVLTQLLPSDAEEDQLLIDLQSGADLAGLDFVQIRFAPRLTEEGFMQMPMQTSFDGSYHQLLYFLDYLQVYERALRIDELRIDETDGKEMNISISANAFYATE